MRPLCAEWIAEQLKPFPPGRLLDVGSYDINGQPRSYLEGWGYTGTDAREGPAP